MALDFDQLFNAMFQAAAGMLKDSVPDIESFAKTEFQKLAHTLVSIGEQLAGGVINQEQAELLLDMQKNATRAVFTTVEGLGILAAEAAINAALDAVKGIVNSAVKFTLL